MSDLTSILSEGQQPAIEQPAQAEPQEREELATGETTASPAVEQEDEVEKHRKGLEAGIAAERQRRQAAELRAQQLEQQLRQREQPAQQTQAAKPTPADGLARPKRDQYPDQEAYEDALLDFGDKRREARDQQATAERQQQDAEKEFTRQLNEIVTNGQKARPDFDAVINSGLAPYLTVNLQRLLVHAKDGHEVAYWLGKNPTEAARVSNLPPPQMLFELGVIKAGLKAEPEDDRQPIPQTLTNQRNAAGQFTRAYAGPTPLDDVLSRKT
jgi:hypothetical protein